MKREIKSEIEEIIKEEERKRRNIFMLFCSLCTNVVLIILNLVLIFKLSSCVYGLQ